MKFFSVTALGVAITIAAPAFAANQQTFTGVVTDSMCDTGDHSRMRMGPSDAQCTVACINEHGAMYVLYDGKNSYTLSDQQTPEKLAGQKVKVVGILNAKTSTIQVDSIALAK